MVLKTRDPSTTTRGVRFAEATVEAVWRRGRAVPGNDPAVFRKDACGAWMRRSAYGETSEYGWEIDHVVAVANGGSDELRNLQPLQWKNNRFKGDKSPATAYCVVTN